MNRVEHVSRSPPPPPTPPTSKAIPGLCQQTIPIVAFWTVIMLIIIKAALANSADLPV